ncbi:MAG: RNA 2',3'-cyclic phosphodiesterase [Alphaproteobacteria bacterium]
MCAGAEAHLEGGLPGARWTPLENLHLTLRFIGEVQEPAAEEIAEALWRIRAPAFRLSLKGVGKFGGESKRSPSRLVYAGVEHGAALTDLVRLIEQALTSIGLPCEVRKFHAHVTLARLKDTPAPRIAQFIQDHNLYASREFEVGEFALFSSRPGNEASHYEALQHFALLPTSKAPSS